MPLPLDIPEPPTGRARYTAALVAADGYFSRAAKALGLDVSTLWQAVEAHPELWPQGLVRHPRGGPPLPEAVREAQAQDLLRLLTEHGGNVCAAAAAAGLSHSAIRARIHRLLGGWSERPPTSQKRQQRSDFCRALHAAGGDIAETASALGISLGSCEARLRSALRRNPDLLAEARRAGELKRLWANRARRARQAESRRLRHAALAVGP